MYGCRGHYTILRKKYHIFLISGMRPEFEQMLKEKAYSTNGFETAEADMG